VLELRLFSVLLHFSYSLLQLSSRYFGGIKLGTGGLVRAYGGVASECLRNAPTCLVKSKVLCFFLGVALLMNPLLADI
jgi:hypothetical protein